MLWKSEHSLTMRKVHRSTFHHYLVPSSETITNAMSRDEYRLFSIHREGSFTYRKKIEFLEWISDGRDEANLYLQNLKKRKLKKSEKDKLDTMKIKDILERILGVSLDQKDVNDDLQLIVDILGYIAWELVGNYKYYYSL
ncbi:MAG: hypothetical protein EZS28_031643 [Streblomastix strix]|uniref:Uncharacterized protein n=1 Tax=Streblomastix strix TaxID=222440 RepID=A0A5J4US08_9EUKA|nr:MAG: hypothetical protein EZS28_031643 [Streblomastix strix]